MPISQYGITVDVPEGWDARFFRNPTSGPCMHAANFALPMDNSEFGSAATDQMQSGDLFVTLVEYVPDDNLTPGVGLYAAREKPSGLRMGDFAGNALQHNRAAQAGLQRFFSIGNRCFCLYVVIGSERGPARVVDDLNHVLKSVEIDPTFTPPKPSEAP